MGCNHREELGSFPSCGVSSLARFFDNTNGKVEKLMWDHVLVSSTALRAGLRLLTSFYLTNMFFIFID